jgi:hypothetical protein
LSEPGPLLPATQCAGSTPHELRIERPQLGDVVGPRDEGAAIEGGGELVPLGRSSELRSILPEISEAGQPTGPLGEVMASSTPSSLQPPVSWMSLEAKSPSAGSPIERLLAMISGLHNSPMRRRGSLLGGGRSVPPPERL